MSCIRLFITVSRPANWVSECHIFYPWNQQELGFHLGQIVILLLINWVLGKPFIRLSCVVKKKYVQINEKRGATVLPNSLYVSGRLEDVEIGAEINLFLLLLVITEYHMWRQFNNLTILTRLSIIFYYQRIKNRILVTQVPVGNVIKGNISCFSENN